MTAHTHTQTHTSYISSVQFSSVAQSCLSLCDPMNCSTPGLPVHHQLPEFTQTHVIELLMPSSHLILCHPLLLPPIPPSIRVFSNELTLRMRWPKYWSFSLRISPSNEHPGLVSCRMDWLDLLEVQGTLKSLLQHHSSKASILWYSAGFIVSHPYMTTGTTIALTRQTFVGQDTPHHIWMIPNVKYHTCYFALLSGTAFWVLLEILTNMFLLHTS